MRSLFRVLSTVLALGALGACATTDDRLPEARFNLTERQGVMLAPRLSVTYDGAEDSRCPDNARCIWAGQVAYRFTIRIGSVAQAFYLVPGQPGYTNPALRGSRIELDRSLVAPPRGMAEVRPASYPVTFNMYSM
ncbi:hypothetical protein [Massilia niastensis]|uniref:hypothetical protein n=1 Tax=Massilia niastensis TaxID=544911 RepID=UPI0003A89A1E|nr:hypothetical protein [Massilia niastensis]